MDIHKLTSVLLILGTCLGAPRCPAERFDISALTGRRDAETLGWQEWEIGTERDAARDLEQGRLELRAVNGQLHGFLHKSALATGATIAATSAASDPWEIFGLVDGLRSPQGRSSMSVSVSR